MLRDVRHFHERFMTSRTLILFLIRTVGIATVVVLLASTTGCGRRRGSGRPSGGDSGVETDSGVSDAGPMTVDSEMPSTDAGPATPDATTGDASVDAGARCGNRMIEGSEVCDGVNLDGETCASQGFASGTLMCNLTCSGFSTAGCVAAATNAPTITSFTGAPTTLTPSSSVTFTAVASDPDGVADLYTAELYDAETDYVYGYMTKSGSTFTGTFSWDTINAVITIDFTTSTLRTFSVRVTDAEGYTATRNTTVTLSCGVAGYGACSGECRSLSTTTDCGACGRACPGGCSAGSCMCPVGSSDCGGVCMAHTTESCASLVNGSLGVDSSGLLYVYYSGSWRGICDDSFDTVDGTVACTQFGKSHSLTSTSRSGPSSSFWLDDVACTGAEVRLDACSHTAWGTHNCGSTEWISLSCAW